MLTRNDIYKLKDRRICEILTVIKGLQTKNIYSSGYYQDAQIEMHETTTGIREDK